MLFLTAGAKDATRWVDFTQPFSFRLAFASRRGKDIKKNKKLYLQSDRDAQKQEKPADFSTAA